MRLVPVFSSLAPRLHRFLDGWPVIAVGLAVLGLLAVGKFVNADSFSVLVWGDRDLWRGLDFGAGDSSRGPESGSGFRPPGGFFYMLLHAILRLSPDIKAANIALGAMLVISVLMLGATLWRTESPRAGVIGGLALFSNGALLQSYGVWNPGFVFLFAVAATCAMLLFVATRHWAYLAVSAFSVGLGMQIHMQITMLLIALPIVMAAYRIWPRPFLVAAAAGGLALAYLPSAVVDPSVVASFGDYNQRVGLGQYVSGSTFTQFGIPESIKQFFTATGGSARTLAAAIRPRYDAIYWLLWIADVGATLLAIYAAVAIIMRRRTPVFERVSPFGVALIIVVVYTAVFAFARVNFRHFAALVPAVTILVAVGAEDIIRRLSDGGPSLAKTVSALAIIAFICGRAATVGALNFTHTALAPYSYLVQREIADHVKGTYYSDHETFEKRTSYFVQDGGVWRLKPASLGNRMATIYRLSRRIPTGASDGRCLVVVPNWLSGGLAAEAIAADLAAGSAFAALSARFADHTSSRNLYYFPYTTAEGNCLKSFPNPYIPTAFERQFLSFRPPVRDISVTAVRSSATGAAFVIEWGAQPFPWAIDIEHDGATQVAILRGRILRGHTGLATEILKEIRLRFEGQGRVVEVEIGPVAVGDTPAGTLAPWRSPRFSLPEGTHGVRLETLSKMLGPIRVELGSLTVVGGPVPSVRASGAPGSGWKVPK